MSDNTFIVLLFAGFGLLIGIFGWAWYYVTGRRALKLAEDSNSWPTTQARMLESTVREVIRRGSKGARSVTYWPVVRYEYTVGGARHEADVIQFGMTEQASRGAAEAFVKDRPVGATVSCSYNPATPAVATLDTSAQGAGSRIRTAWLLLILLPILSAALGGVVILFL